MTIAAGVRTTREPDGSIVLSLDGFELRCNPMGRRIWEALGENIPVPAIIDGIAREFEAPRPIVEGDVLEFVGSLRTNFLVCEESSRASAAAEVKIRTLIELDNPPAANALADSLGDRYLYGRNRMFGRIRDLACDFGFRFVCDDTPLWRDYLGLPLLTLHRILEGGAIPYFDNGNLLPRLMETDADLALPPRFIASSMKHNYVLHEAAHCVGDRILRSHRERLDPVCGSERERKVLEAILVESFANTVETMGAAEDSSIPHWLFYTLNSYMTPNAKSRNLVVRARGEGGPEAALLLFFAAYARANLAMGKPRDSTYAWVHQAAGIPAVSCDLTRDIVDQSFRLNQDFREETTPAWFRLLGCEQEYRAIAEESWLDRPEHRAAIAEIGRILIDAALRDL